MAFLAIKDLDKNFGGLKAVHGLNFEVVRGDVLGLIGPNGAGKSTVLNLIGGILKPTRGQIFYEGKEITKYSAHRRAKAGIARVYQRNALFKSMTVLDNVLVGGYLKSKHRLSEIFIIRPSDLKRMQGYAKRAREIIEFVGLKKQSDEMAVNLPHGNQRMLCIAIAMASEPKLLLLDEPLTGMNAEEAGTMINIVKSLWRKRGITTIVVEHNMKAVLGMCEHTIVLNYGEKMMEADSPKECIDNPEVIKAYLGEETDVF